MIYVTKQPDQFSDSSGQAGAQPSPDAAGENPIRDDGCAEVLEAYAAHQWACWKRDGLLVRDAGGLPDGHHDLPR